MKKTVTFVDLTVYEHLLPLVAGYLQAYACQDPFLRAAYDFETYSAPLTTPPEQILADLARKDSAVFAFSCYVWNMGLVKSLLAGLRRSRPDAQLLLGGPQVIGHAQRYLSPAAENLVLANGEGERIFANYLRELADSRPDLTRVRGLSLFRDGELLTTEKEEKILDLDEIPSPFLGGVFPRDRYTYAIFETNRGCPFRCTFCFWGLGESRVSRFSEERVREELAWLCDSGFFGIFLADANWGMLPRDVELSRHLVACKQRTGVPYVVVVSSAKNRPERLVEIAEIFQQAGIMTTQSMAVQSLDEETLRQVERSNIKVDGYAQAQTLMNEKRIASFVELIWPLPGETLDSFRRGVNRLCEIRAQSFIPYPLMLLNGTKMAEQREEHGFVTIDEPARTGGEAEIVVATRTVDSDAMREGLWFCFAVLTAYNARGLYCLSHFLSSTGRASYADLFTAFADFCRRQDHPVVRYYRQALDDYTYCEFAHWGRLLHFVLHAYRDDLDQLFHRFAASQPWWDEETRVLFEIDMVNKPYVYSGRESYATRHVFEELELTPVDHGFLVRAPRRCLPLLRELVEMVEGADEASDTFRVDYRRQQLPCMEGRGLDHNAHYCHGVMTNIRNAMPRWIAQPAAEIAA